MGKKKVISCRLTLSVDSCRLIQQCLVSSPAYKSNYELQSLNLYLQTSVQNALSGDSNFRAPNKIDLPALGFMPESIVNAQASDFISTQAVTPESNAKWITDKLLAKEDVEQDPFFKAFEYLCENDLMTAELNILYLPVFMMFGEMNAKIDPDAQELLKPYGVPGID